MDINETAMITEQSMSETKERRIRASCIHTRNCSDLMLTNNLRGQRKDDTPCEHNNASMTETAREALGRVNIPKDEKTYLAHISEAIERGRNAGRMEALSTLPTMTQQPAEYEVLPDIEGETADNKLKATYTPNNGIRIRIEDRRDDDDPEIDCVEFDFANDEDARHIGAALLRWGGGLPTMTREELAQIMLMSTSKMPLYSKFSEVIDTMADALIARFPHLITPEPLAEES